MNHILNELSNLGIVPVIALDRAEDAKSLAQALCEGGLPCAEVTFRTAAAEESIAIMSREFPEMLVGAGTVLTTDQVDRAVAAGAKFIVSPGFNPKIVQYCIDKGIPITPGCSSPTDIEQALEFGLEVVKFFPAEASGGLNKIKAMAAPYTTLKFMPTGGINEKNIISYLDFPKIIACGGSFMVTNELIAAGNFEEIKNLTKKAVDLMLGFEVAHVGINGANAQEADSTATKFENTFGFSKKTGVSSIFAGNQIEIMKEPFKGHFGHLAIRTNSIKRAIYHLEKQGFTFLQDTAKYDDKKQLKAIYLTEEYGGFAVHLVQK